MPTETPHPSSEFIARVHPIVLVGGQSRRFGRDKLREPWGQSGRLLVQHPIESLRAVFGPRVMLVGNCHPSIVPLADGFLTDDYPGAGPIGGIVSALRALSRPLFVLAGDMPNASPSAITRILGAAEKAFQPMAVLAATNRIQPCAGVYFPTALGPLLEQLGRGDSQLQTALPIGAAISVPVSEGFAANVNFDANLGAAPRRTGRD